MNFALAPWPISTQQTGMVRSPWNLTIHTCPLRWSAPPNLSGGFCASQPDRNEIFLFLEDDLDFNRHFFYNLAAWTPLQRHSAGSHFFASLFNPGVRFLRSFPDSAYSEASPSSVVGSQAMILSRATARYLVTCWGVEPGPFADRKVSRLAGRVCPLFYHLPSLVQHIGTKSVWGGPFTQASDFDKQWKALDNPSH